MPRPIGYYVHHHGDGHRQRALAIARAARAGVTLLGTGLSGRTGEIPCVDLADDRMTDTRFDGRDQGERPTALHYAPIDHEGVRLRVARIADWIATARPGLFVIDVSVEIAMLARLASVPTVYVRLNGARTDRPHLDAFRGASALLAPFHADLDDEQTPRAIRRRTSYFPGIVSAGERMTVEQDLILVVIGRGGAAHDGDTWALAAASVPAMRWRVIGPCTIPQTLPPNLELRGWVEDAADMIASAAIIVGGAGDGLIGAAIAHRRPLICVPEPRPYGEQVSKANRLAILGAAVMCAHVPLPEQWPDLIRRAQALDRTALARLDMPNGAKNAADWLRMLADETNQQRRRSA